LGAATGVSAFFATTGRRGDFAAVVLARRVRLTALAGARAALRDAVGRLVALFFAARRAAGRFIIFLAAIRMPPEPFVMLTQSGA
jgi:hypothetical protein